MELRIPYEVVKEAVDKAGNPEEPGTVITFCVWISDNQYEIVIERPKEWSNPDHFPQSIKVRTKDGKTAPFKLTRLQWMLWHKTPSLPSPFHPSEQSHIPIPNLTVATTLDPIPYTAIIPRARGLRDPTGRTKSS